MTGRLRDVAWLGQAMAAADDAALQRVVSLLDGLRERGSADGVLDGARRRLRRLRPPRPLGFARLLFLPFNGAIVPAARWRRGEALLPRSVLAVLTTAVQAGLGPQAVAAFEAEFAGRGTEEAEAVRRIGARLWPAAAKALPADCPLGWDSTGIAAADYPEIAALCRPIWAAGVAMWDAMAADRPPEGAALAALAALVPAGPRPFTLALAALMAHASDPGRLAETAASLDPALRGPALAVLDGSLDMPIPEFERQSLGDATLAALSLAGRLDSLEGCGLLTGDRQRQVQALRRAAEQACRERFLASAEQHLIAPLLALAEAPEVGDEAVAAIEAEARELRGLEAAGRRLGGSAAYDRALRAMAETLAALGGRTTDAGGLRPVDLARTIEILAGPDTAARLLATQPR
jgi:hypothetical protein